MSKFLIHIHIGPENLTKAGLGFLVVLSALKKGHTVELFLAGDGAALIGDAGRMLSCLWSGGARRRTGPPAPAG